MHSKEMKLLTNLVEQLQTWEADNLGEPCPCCGEYDEHSNDCAYSDAEIHLRNMPIRITETHIN